MKKTIISFVCILLISCHSNNNLREWILNNQQQLTSATDSVIQDYYKTNNLDSNWISSSVAITEYAPNIIGALAKKAGDSTECIVIELTFYKNLNLKRSIMIAANDSTCLNKLNAIILKTDSTNNFISETLPKIPMIKRCYKD
jgi:hypothetical protein